MNDAEWGLYLVGVSNVLGDIDLIAAGLVLALGSYRLAAHLMGRLLSQGASSHASAHQAERHTNHHHFTESISHPLPQECSRTAVAASTSSNATIAATWLPRAGPARQPNAGTKARPARVSTASRISIPNDQTSWKRGVPMHRIVHQPNGAWIAMAVNSPPATSAVMSSGTAETRPVPATATTLI